MSRRLARSWPSCGPNICDAPVPVWNDTEPGPGVDEKGVDRKADVQRKVAAREQLAHAARVHLREELIDRQVEGAVRKRSDLEAAELHAIPAGRRLLRQRCLRRCAERRNDAQDGADTRPDESGREASHRIFQKVSPASFDAPWGVQTVLARSLRIPQNRSSTQRREQGDEGCPRSKSSPASGRVGRGERPARRRRPVDHRRARRRQDQDRHAARLADRRQPDRRGRRQASRATSSRKTSTSRSSPAAPASTASPSSRRAASSSARCRRARR